MHHDDDLQLGSIYLHRKGTYVDRDDIVADILENNEAVVLQRTIWVSCGGNNPSNTQVTLTVPGASQDTKVQLSGRRAISVRSVDSGFVTSQSISQESDRQSIQNLIPQPRPSPYHVNLTVGSQSPLLGVAGRSNTRPFHQGNSNDWDSRTSLWGEGHGHRFSGISSFDDDEEDNGTKEREEFDSSKSMLQDGSADQNDVQESNVVQGKSQSDHSHTPSPIPTDSEDITSCEQSIDEDEGEDSEHGKVHIIELHKGNEPLGIKLDDRTSSELIPGLFIGAIDENGFAFKSGKFQHNDRILACNGIDFTKDHTEPLKVIFYRMEQEPRLKIAISREVNLPEATHSGGAEDKVDDKAPSSGEATPTSKNTHVIRIEQTVEVIKSSCGPADSGLTDGVVVTKAIMATSQDDLMNEVSTKVEEVTTPTLSSPMSHVLPPSPPINTSHTSAQGQKRLSFENTSEKSSTVHFSSQQEDICSGEVVIPPLKQTNGEGAWNLRGVEVCGETSVVVHHNAQQFTWEGFGLKLHVYEGCLPNNMEQCIINIKASIAGLYEFPENTHLVSAVFWLRCIPECKFDKSVGLEIQHCGNLEGGSRLSFVRAICCQRELPYTFKDIGGDFATHSFYGFIELKGFSGLAAIQEGAEQRYYLASLLYKEVNNYHNRCIVEIYIAVTWNIDTHHSVLITRFKDASVETEQPIEFESNQVEFRISNISHEKWDIKCLNSPVVKKADVDRFTPGKTSWVPCSKFKAKFSDELNLVCDLECDVDIAGAMQPHNKFVIDISPQAGSRQPYYPSPAQSMSNSIRLTDLNYSSLLKQLSIHAAKWREIGTYLGFKQGELDNIHSMVLHLSTDLPVSCLNEMLSRWLQWAPGDSRGSVSFATLEALKAALNQVGLAAAAYDLHL